MLDHLSPSTRRVARGERVGCDLVVVVPARAETLNEMPQALDVISGADEFALGVVHSQPAMIRPPAMGAGPIVLVVTIGEPAQAWSGTATVRPGASLF